MFHVSSVSEIVRSGSAVHCKTKNRRGKEKEGIKLHSAPLKAIFGGYWPAHLIKPDLGLLLTSLAAASSEQGLASS